MVYSHQNYLCLRLQSHLTTVRSVSIIVHNWGAGAGPNNNAAS